MGGGVGVGDTMMMGAHRGARKVSVTLCGGELDDDTASGMSVPNE